jgi:ABC-2 type transport system permease protein
VGLGWAFFERQTNLWKRYWAWEIVWLLYGVVNTLAITFIANEAGRTGSVSKAEQSRLTMFLLIGTLVWAYMSAVLDDMSLTVMWERWEGTIEHTLMAPVPRVVHLVGMSAFGILHAFIRTSLVMACALPFFHVDLGQADWVTAAAVVAVGSVSLIGLGILASILPLLYPERGEQMSFMVQALVLLVSGVYYSVSVLPGWLRGIRDALLNGSSVGNQAGTIAILAVFGVVLVPASLLVFGLAERWAKKTGQLKRQG